MSNPTEGLRVPPAPKLPTIVFASAALACAYARAQQPPIQIQVPPPAQQPAAPVLTLHASSRAVLVDVVVTDAHGQVIHGLKTADFQLVEDGQPQTIASLEEHHAPTAAAAPLAPLPPNTFSNARHAAASGDTNRIVFLLDALNSPPTAQAYVRDQLMAYFKTMPAGTQVAMFQLGMQLRLLQGFTSDPETLRAAIKNRDKPALTPLPNGRGYVAQAFHMDSLDSAMRSLGTYLATYPGRKSLIWFTGRIPRNAYDDGAGMGGALHDSESFLFDYSKATESLVLGQVSVYPIDSRGLQTDPAFSAASSRGPSPRSAAAFSTRQFFEHTDLDDVAQATGGKAFYNTNGIRQSVAEVVEGGASYYTLSYYPSNKDWNGKYRKLKLEIADPSQKPTLQYRHGYYAVVDARSLNPPAPPAARAASTQAAGRIQLTHHDTPGPAEAAFAQTMQLGAVDPGKIVFNAHVRLDAAPTKLGKTEPLPDGIHLSPTYRDRPFRTALLTCDVLGGQLQLDLQPNGRHAGKVQFVALILDDQGGIVDSASSTIDLNLSPGNYAIAQASGVEMLLKLAIPEKGSYFLRTGVLDHNSGKAGALEVSTGDIKVGTVAP